MPPARLRWQDDSYPRRTSWPSAATSSTTLPPRSATASRTCSRTSSRSRASRPTRRTSPTSSAAPSSEPPRCGPSGAAPSSTARRAATRSCSAVRRRTGPAHVTVYNHLDVQPASKETEPWRTEPFRFTKQGDTYFGRGTTDDKGPALTALLGARAAMEAGVPLNIKFLWEIEEEIGSPQLRRDAEGDRPRREDRRRGRLRHGLGLARPAVALGGAARPAAHHASTSRPPRPTSTRARRAAPRATRWPSSRSSPPRSSTRRPAA